MTYPKEKLIELTKKIYNLTILFPKKEPLRYKIREIADEILLNFLFKNNPGNIADSYMEILDSFFEIAKEQKWVSPSEILFLQQEYKNLQTAIKKEVDKSKINGLSFNERQEKILEILKEKEKIQVGQIKKMLPSVSKRTLRRDFQNLLKKGIIERVGEKSDTFYCLKK